MNLIKEYYGAILTVLLGLVISLAIFSLIQKEEEDVAKHHSEWCFLKLMPYGQHMSIDETEGGYYQYQLYAADQGVEVWIPCK
jgi:hypothetical protein